MSTATEASKKRKSRLWWVIHQWVGLKLSVFMSFILLTGTVAVFGHEIDWLINPDIRVDASTVTDDVNWVVLAESIAAYDPEAKLRHITAPIDKGFAATAYVAEPGGLKRIYLHPNTGEVYGEASGLNVQGALRWIHRSLILKARIGVPIVSLLSIVLAISLVTSFVIYKKWWKGFFKPIRNRNARTWFGDFHRLMGVWSLWFTILMILTGFWYLVESLGGRAPGSPNIWRKGIEQTVGVSANDLGGALVAAKAAMPGLRIEQVEFPDPSVGAYRFSGQHKAVLVRPRANKVWVTADTKSADLAADARDLNAHQRIAEMADPLHFGNFGGVWTKLIWFVFGMMMTLLSLSGVVIYALRLFKAENQTATPSTSMAAVARGVGWIGLPASLLVLMSIILLVQQLA